MQAIPIKRKPTEKQTKGKPAQRTPTRGTKFHMESLKRRSRKMLHITPRGITKKHHLKRIWVEKSITHFQTKQQIVHQTI